MVEILPAALQPEEDQAEAEPVGVTPEDVNLLHPLHLLPVNLHHLAVEEKKAPAADS